MTNRSIIEKYNKKIENLQKHNRLYYDKNSPKISDAEYDQIKKEVILLEKKFSYLTTIYLLPIWLSPIFFIYLSKKINFVSDFYLFIISAIVYLIFFIIILIIKFKRVNNVSSYLMIPYLLWSCYALFLNFNLYILN